LLALASHPRVCGFGEPSPARKGSEGPGLLGRRAGPPGWRWVFASFLGRVGMDWAALALGDAGRLAAFGVAFGVPFGEAPGAAFGAPRGPAVMVWPLPGGVFWPAGIILLSLESSNHGSLIIDRGQY
jgi:hypothetical protein